MIELRTQRLLLREFRLSDFDAVREYDSDPEIHRYEKVIVPSEEATRAYLQRAQEWAQEQPRSHYLFAITISPDERARGRVSLTLNNPDMGTWEIGWTLHRQFWGHGYATEAAREALRFGFEDLKAHRIASFCNVNNTASFKVMERLSMVREGRLREERWWDGHYCDEYVYGLLEREWAAQR